MTYKLRHMGLDKGIPVIKYVGVLERNSWQAILFDLMFNKNMSTSLASSTLKLSSSTINRRLNRMIAFAQMDSTKWFIEIYKGEYYHSDSLRGIVLRRCVLGQESFLDITKEGKGTFHEVREAGLFFYNLWEHHTTVQNKDAAK